MIISQKLKSEDLVARNPNMQILSHIANIPYHSTHTLLQMKITTS